jgi:hypothetical protein
VCLSHALRLSAWEGQRLLDRTLQMQCYCAAGSAFLAPIWAYARAVNSPCGSPYFSVASLSGNTRTLPRISKELAPASPRLFDPFNTPPDFQRREVANHLPLCYKSSTSLNYGETVILFMISDLCRRRLLRTRVYSEKLLLKGVLNGVQPRDDGLNPIE